MRLQVENVTINNLQEILDTFLPKRFLRNKPKIVKKIVSKFCFKKPKHRGTGQRVEAPKFHITNQSFSLN